MKKIKISGIANEANGTFSVHLGNGTSHNFRQQKQAQHFLNNTGKFLNESLFALRKHHKDLVVISHDYWLYFNTKHNSQHAAIEREIEAHLQQSTQCFNLCYLRADWANGNHFVFIHLFNICDNLKNAIAKISRFSAFKRETQKVYEFTAILKAIISVETELNQYAQNKATAYFTRPQHRDLLGKKEFQPKLTIAA